MARPLQTALVRVYHQSVWFWLQRMFYILLFGSAFAGAFESNKVGIIALIFIVPITSFLIFIDFAAHPIAVEIHPDFFTLRFLWKRRNYPFADVSNITRDEVHFKRSDTVQTVRVGFHSRNHLQLLFPSAREKLYQNLITAWHAAIDLKASVPAAGKAS